MTEENNGQVPDGPEYRKDGTIWLHIDGKRATIKRPKLSEYKDLREAFYGVQDQQLANNTAALNSTGPSPKKEAFTDEEGVLDDVNFRQAQLDWTLATNQATRKASDQNEDLYRDWVQLVIDKLSSDMPAIDDAPLWLLNQELGQEFFNHWRAVPLARGAR